jgi:MFS family permease
MTQLPFRAGTGALVLEGLFSRLSFGLISFALPLYARHLGFTISEIGLLVALNTAVSLALKPMMGLLADRVGCKRVLLAGIALRSVVAGLLGAASAPWHLFAIRGVHGLSMSLRDPSVSALLADEGGEKQVASAFAWYQTAKTAAAQLSKSAAGFLLALTGANFGIVFFVAFGLSIVPAIMVAIFVKSDRADSGERDVRLEEPDLWRQTETAGALRSRPSAVPFMALGFLIRATSDMLDGLLPIITIEYAGLTTGQAGVIYTIAAVVLIVSGPMFGWLADHVSSVKVLTIRGAANALSSAIYLFAPGFLGLLTAKSLDDLGKAAYRPAWGSLVAGVSSFDRRTRARTMSILMVGEDLGSILGPVLAGLLWSTMGIAAALGTRIALALFTELYVVTVTRRQRHSTIAQVNGSRPILEATGFGEQSWPRP